MVQVELRAITDATSATQPILATRLQELRSLAANGKALAEQQDEDTRIAILRATYSLERRLAVWNELHRVFTRHVPVSTTVASPVPMSEQIKRVEEAIKGRTNTTQWQAYLQLSQLKRLDADGSTEERRQIARQILRRMHSRKLTSDHETMFARQPYADFERALRRWANEPIDYAAFLAELENYEVRRASKPGGSVAEYVNRARWSPDPTVAELGRQVDLHYRNANLRLVLTSELLNRLLPEPTVEEDDVEERILGADVYGRSRTSSRLRVRLLPDRRRWRVGLEATGDVESETAAYRGPATVYNQGTASFLVRKLLLIDRRGISVWQAEAEADSESNLTGLETNFDGLPVLGWVARSIARDEVDSSYWDAQAETELRLERRATERFDDEVHERLTEIEDKFKRHLLGPLDKMELDSRPLDMRTTEDELVVRYRIANNAQLAAHTPRPRAPRNSLMNVQLHESLLNNILGSLQLEGRRSELRQLYRDLADTFEHPSIAVPDDIEEGVVIQFAKEEPVRVQCEDGRLAIVIRIKELSGRDRRWKNFAVRCHYSPDPTQEDANLVRDGIIELAGRRLSTLDRAILSGIFSKVFSKRRPLTVINDRLEQHPGLADVEVNQFVIRDGWMGVSIGPRTIDVNQRFAEDTDQVETR